jgi:hypothetical protein
MVARRGGKVVVRCQGQLARVLRSNPQLGQIISDDQPLGPFDFHSPLLSLPLVLQTTLSSIPAEVPYLFPEPLVVESWRKKLGPSDGLVRIGLNWAGNPAFKEDRARSLHLDQLAPLAAAKGIRFYSLHKGAAVDQADHPPAGMQLVNLAPDLHDFADTAAVMSLMDLILTTDTAVAHLAGALGRPTWVMLQFMPDFKWLLHREDSPWYPTLRLFRQRKTGDWDDVIHRVAGELMSEKF